MSTGCKRFAYALTRLLRPLTTGTLSDMLAMMADDDIATVKRVLGDVIDATETNLLRKGDGGSTGTLAPWGSLQNASVSTQNSAHKTYGRRHDDDDDVRGK